MNTETVLGDRRPLNQAIEANGAAGPPIEEEEEEEEDTA